jgi:23S rRNA (uracil1939-C5)-methyltransferase
MKVRELSTFLVQDLSLGGKAFARDEGGRAVFIDRGLPGDTVRARLTKSKKSFAEARYEGLESPGADRIAARCVHVDQCGGCRLQEMPYDAQVRIKERQVGEALRHLGGMSAPPVRAIVPAPDAWHYRNKMEFSFMPTVDGPVLGLHERGTFDKIFAQRECWIASPLIMEAVKLTQQFAIAHRWQAYHPGRHDGIVRFLTVRHLQHTQQCAVHLLASSDQIPGLAEWAKAMHALSPQVHSVTLGINTSRANVAFAESETVLAGDDHIVEKLCGLEFEVVGNAFLQTNSAQAEHLYEGAIAAAQLSGSETVLDLYSGAGTLTLLFARAAGAAVGVESVPHAVERARRNALRNGIASTRFECGDTRQVLREWARGEREGAVKPDLVVVDPPRAGLHPRVVARVAELKPARIVYVSCNPATFARDAKDFLGYGYQLAEVTPYDMFPHTPHIECVARLEPLGS